MGTFTSFSSRRMLALPSLPNKLVDRLGEKILEDMKEILETSTSSTFISLPFEVSILGWD